MNPLNEIICGDAKTAMTKIDNNSISLIITSPPYWNTKNYKVEDQIGQDSYDKYLNDLLSIWEESERVLQPNGKLVIVSPIMPISKSINNEQHTRLLLNISFDIEHKILNNIYNLHRYSLFIWQKQTSKKMFGSYPYPPNLYEDNTIEFLNVFVKGGKPIKRSNYIKEQSVITKEEWLNLTMQTWPMYPDTKNRKLHPAPFPVVLPLRFIKMYSFIGDAVLDVFNGIGTTCLAAKALNRNFIGIDINNEYCSIAKDRLFDEEIDPKAIFLEKVSVKREKR